jgi:hypothetical protein
MTRGHYLYREFLNVAKVLNQQLNVVPVLYGSLGLGKVTQLDFSPQDIDILVPLPFLKDQWQTLQQTMEQLGYTMIDVQEHEFMKNDITIGFAFTEELVAFADIDYKSLQVFEDNGTTYHLLTIEDYLKVYTQSLQDGYRRTKNNSKDLIKINILKNLVQK